MHVDTWLNFCIMCSSVVAKLKQIESAYEPLVGPPGEGWRLVSNIKLNSTSSRGHSISQ